MKAENIVKNAFRDFFEIEPDRAYFNAAYIGPVLREASLAGQAAFARKAQPWNIQPDDFFTHQASLRKELAKMIDARPEDIALVPSASYGLALAAANISLPAGGEIVTIEDQFPSQVYAAWRHAEEYSAKCITVARPENSDWYSAIFANLGKNTALVSIPAVHWTDGTLTGLENISQWCRENDVPLVCDLSQSLGVMPFSVRETPVDFAIIAGYKWLLGPYGLSYVYVNPRYHENGRALEENWINRKGSENFAGLVNYTAEYQPGARRFDFGENSAQHQLVSARLSLELLNKTGVEVISDFLGQITRRIAKRATRLGFQLADARFRSRHLMGLYYPGNLPADTVSWLAGRKVHVSVRGHSIRISPHIYNTDEDLERLLTALEDLLARPST